MVYDTRKLNERPKKATSHQPKIKVNKSKPSKDHPWRNNLDKKTMPSFKESLFYEKEDIEIDNILKELFNSTRAWV